MSREPMILVHDWLALELATRGRARTVVALSPAGGWEEDSREAARVETLFRRMYWLPASAELVELPGLGHVPTRDDPELVARTVLEVTARRPVAA